MVLITQAYHNAWFKKRKKKNVKITFVRTLKTKDNEDTCLLGCKAVRQQVVPGISKPAVAFIFKNMMSTNTKLHRQSTL